MKSASNTKSASLPPVASILVIDTKKPVKAIRKDVTHEVVEDSSPHSVDEDSLPQLYDLKDYMDTGAEYGVLALDFKSHQRGDSYAFQ